jgi:hypothetical protein
MATLLAMYRNPSALASLEGQVAAADPANFATGGVDPVLNEIAEI